MMKKIQLLALSALLSLAACGGSADSKALANSGFKKLGTSDYAGAQADFEGALGAIEDKASAEYHEAKMGLLEAKANTAPGTAQAEFEAYAATSTHVTTDDIARFAAALLDGGDASAALSVVDAGLKAHPADAKLAGVMTQLKAKAQNDAGLASALEGLGYL